MTKIKNTKKGMAKKTLSISLAVAMLATSNVPVWAAEFTDGTDAVFTSEVEAPVAEEVVEAPVVEDAENIVTAKTSNYTATVKFDKTTFAWNDEVSVSEISVKDADGTDVTYKWAWKVGADEETAVGEEGTGEKKYTPAVDGSDFDKNLYFMIWVEDENNQTLWSETFKAGHFNAVDLKTAGRYGIGWTEFNEGKKTYDGKAVSKTASVAWVNNEGDTVLRDDFIINYSNDLTNAGTVHVTATPKDAKYEGVVAGDFVIEPKTINSTNYTDLKATFKDDKKVFAWTGNEISFTKDDLTLIDEKTGDDVSKLVANVTSKANATAVGKEYAAKIDLEENDAVKNYKVENDLAFYSDAVGATYEITARSLTDCVITFDSVEWDDTLLNENNAASAVKRALVSVVAKDGTKINKDKFFASWAADVIVSEGGFSKYSDTPYTVTIKPTASSNCLTDKTTASVMVVKSSLADVVITNTNCAEWNKAEEYTGSQITKDKEKLGDIKTGLVLKESKDGDTLVYGEDYTIEFGENINAGKDAGELIIKGMNAYAGDKKVFYFDIAKAKVTADDLSAVKYLLRNEDVKKPAEYATDFKLVVKGHNSKKAEFTLVEGKEADYTVEYTFENQTGNSIGNKVVATITLNPDGNFEAADGSDTDKVADTLVKKVEIVDPVILDEYIVLKKDSYEYTGAPIIPEFDVVINGKTLVKDKDYVILNTQDVTEVGDAKVVITGKGKYSNKVNAEASFTVVPADASKVKVTLDNCTGETKHVFNGEAHEPDIKTVVLAQNANVKDQFVATYGENVNAGKGTVILTPKKNNKNFTGTKTVEFTIEQAELNGNLTVYDEKNVTVNPWNKGFNYDGSAHTYAKEVFVPTGTLAKYVTADDYEIVYADNVYGKAWPGHGQLGHIFVIGKGNFKGNLKKTTEANGEFDTDGTFTTAEGKKITSIAVSKPFHITPAEIHKNNITVSNGTYREGYSVKPVVNVVVNGKTLVEGKDYKLVFEKINDKEQDRTAVTASKSLKVVVEPINGYVKFASDDKFEFAWGIDKFDFANAEIMVSGTDANPIIKVLNDTILVDPENYDLVVEDGKATVSAKADSKNYTGTQTVEIKHALAKPATPMLEKVTVNGNKATAVLSGECEGAIGYDYVISTDKDCITNKDYDKVNKNILKTTTDFTYVQQGTYYAYCHAWTRDENGQKVFSDWSNAYPFVVGAITPSTPVVTSVKASGSTVTVKYTAAENAAGYDVVLGTAVKTVAGEKRPVEYGTLVKKNIKNGVVTATFKNVPKGTYYAGLHAFNRTNPENNTKVFSPWSNTKKVTVK